MALILDPHDLLRGHNEIVVASWDSGMVDKHGPSTYSQLALASFSMGTV